MTDTPRPTLHRALTGVWPLRIVWFGLPLLAGPAIGDALDGRSDAVRSVASTGAWIGWAVVLLASAVPRSATLTVVRALVPGAAVLAAWSLLDAERPTVAAAGLAASLVALFLMLAPSVTDAFVDGSSYGEERRVALRAPGTLLLGPLPVAWALGAVGAVTGPLLLAAEQWIAGAMSTAIGVPVALGVVTRLHVLSRRWIVFVPAGVVVHDPLQLSEPVLLQRHLVARFAPAEADRVEAAGVVDVTGRALGLVLEVRAAQPISVGRRNGRESIEMEDVTSLLVAPGRPAAALEIALDHRLPVTS